MTKKGSFRIKRVLFVYGIANKKTIWFDHLRGNERRDYLLSLTRCFHREYGIYTYTFHCGRFALKWGYLDK